MFKTKLQELGLVDEADWIDQVGEDAYGEMVAACRYQQNVVVLTKSVDGDDALSSGYDVMLPSGAVVDALQGFHLRGIERYKEADAEADVSVLCALYSVEIEFPRADFGVVNHSDVELVIEQALSSALSQYAVIRTHAQGAHVVDVSFQQEYKTTLVTR